MSDGHDGGDAAEVIAEPLWGRLEVVSATANPDKIAEIEVIIGDALDLLPRPAEVPDVVEDADTLIGNARLKALALVAATGMPALADDTGLFVDALGGQPGVQTARFAGEGASYEDNRNKLLIELDGVPWDQRGAEFRTVALLAWPDGRELAFEGVCRGTITERLTGDNGFGYDPVFIPADGDGRAFAEMTEAEKHDLSHRGRAFRGLLGLLDGAH